MPRLTLGLLCLATFAPCGFAAAVQGPQRSFLERDSESWSPRRLLIEVLDESGAAPDAGSLLCAVIPLGQRYPDMLAPDTIRKGLWSIPVEPDVTYAYGWLEAGRPFVETTVRIGEDERRTRRILELPPKQDAARVDVWILGEYGEPLEAGLLWEVALELRSEAGLLLETFRLYGRTDPPSMLAKTITPGQGRFQLVAIPHASSGLLDCGGAILPPPPYGPVIQEIECGPHGPDHVDLQLWRGGVIDLSVEVPADALAPMTPVGALPWSEVRCFHPVFEESRVLGHSQTVVGNPGVRVRENKVLGPLPPGRHTLQILTPGFRRATVQVDVQARRETSIRVRLRR